MQRDGFFDYEQADTLVSTLALSPFPCEQACACPRTPDDRQTWVLSPEDFTDVTRCLRRLVEDRTQCLLLDLPADPINLSVYDLREWAEKGAKRVVYPVVRRIKGEKFPCGKVAACEQCLQSVARDNQEELAKLLGRKESCDSLICSAFPNLKPAKQQLLLRWATEEEPKKPGRAITIKTLAKAAKVSVQTIHRIKTDAATMNEEVYLALEQMRTARVRRNGAYEVRGE